MEYYFPFPSFLDKSNKTYSDWNDFKRRLSNYSVLQSNSSGEVLGSGTRPGSVLLYLGGQKVLEIIRTASFQNMYDIRDGDASISRSLEKLEELCLPKLLVLFSRYKFFTCKQKESENMCHFISKLYFLSESCEFMNERGNRIRDQMIEGVFSEQLRQRLQTLLSLDKDDIEKMCRETDPCCDTFCKCCFRDRSIGPDHGNLASAHNDSMKDSASQEVLDFKGKEKDSQEVGAKSSSYGYESEHPQKKSPTSIGKVTSAQGNPEVASPNFGENKKNRMMNSDKHNLDLNNVPQDAIFLNDDDDEILDIYDNHLRNKYCGGCGNEDVLTNIWERKEFDEALINLSMQDNVYIVSDVVNAVVNISECERPRLAASKSTLVQASPKPNLRLHLFQKAKKESKKPHQHREKLFFCNCGMSFFTSWTCYQHVREKHPEQAPYKCDQCEAAYMLEESLNEHKLVHTEDGMATCEKCTAKFSDLKSLDKHMRREHKRERYACETCGQTFPYPSWLKAHQMKHTGERPFVCEICGASYPTRVYLRRHIMLHTGERPHKCPYCSKGFIMKGHLIAHVRRHTGERPFICDYCGVSFRKSHDLKYHIRIHTGERPFKCSTCGRAFIRSTHLKRHKRIHTGEKPYTCNICWSKFTRLTNMRSHQRSVHGVEMPTTTSNDQNFVTDATTSSSSMR